MGFSGFLIQYLKPSGKARRSTFSGFLGIDNFKTIDLASSQAEIAQELLRIIQ
jgi:hypothetical protein